VAIVSTRRVAVAIRSGALYGLLTVARLDRPARRLLIPSPTTSVTTLDLRLDGDEVRCGVERFEARTWRGEPERIIVRWSAIDCPPGYEPMGGGVLFVRGPADYEVERYPAELVDLGDDRYGWFDRTHGDRVLVVVFPPGYTAESSSPEPWSSKVHRDRLAVLWTSEEFRYDPDVTWLLKQAEPDVQASSRDINRQRRGSSHTTDEEAIRLRTVDMW
jgi:hypothetical protein